MVKTCLLIKCGMDFYAIIYLNFNCLFAVYLCCWCIYIVGVVRLFFLKIYFSYQGVKHFASRPVGHNLDPIGL